MLNSIYGKWVTVFYVSNSVEFRTGSIALVPSACFFLKTGTCILTRSGTLCAIKLYVLSIVSHDVVFWPYWLSIYSMSRWISSYPRFLYMDFPLQSFVCVCVCSPSKNPYVLYSWSSFKFWRSIWCFDILVEYKILGLYVFFPFRNFLHIFLH